MSTPYAQMVASLQAQELQEQLEALESGDTAGSWFGSASQALNPRDFQKFVVACRKQLIALRKKADGCPSQIFQWLPHFQSKE